MCGIVAGISKKTNVVPILLEGLKKLEYRGYDSSGISILDNGEFNLVKKVGRVKELEKEINQKESFNSTVGVAHTRWSTHGVVNEQNAHPHNSSLFSIVHNGIIENYKEIKKELTDEGYIFKTDTDSEVILHLLDKNYKYLDSVFKSLTETMKVLEGSYALSISHCKNPDILWAAKKESPLIIGKNKDMSLISSDKNAVSGFIDQVYYLNDNEIAKVESDNIEFFTVDAKLIYKPPYPVEKSGEETGKNGYAYYMEKEIFEQPLAIKKTLDDRLSPSYVYLEELIEKRDLISKIENIEIVSCGTSNHAALIAKKWFESILKIPCDVEIASEYRYKERITRPNTLFVSISQSGETADTLAALKKVKDEDLHLCTLSICNVSHSTIDRESDITILTKAGPEIGVASTKAFTTQLTTMLMLLWSIGEEKEILSSQQRLEIAKELNLLPILMNDFIQAMKVIDSLVPEIAKSNSALFMGRGEYGALSMEGALKLKEISYIHAESFFAGELKHGSLALVEENTPIIAIAPSNKIFNKLYSNVEEVLSRRGKVIILTDKNIKTDGLQVVKMPECSELLAPICYALPLQYLAFKVAKKLGHDIDKPRNLAKSVTVE